MTQKLPIFPLQLVVFPGEQLNLHIFEPKYRELIADVEAEGITFCVPTVFEGRVLPIATEVQLTKVVNRYPTGESDISTLGKKIYFLEQHERNMPGKGYAGAHCRELVADFDEDLQLNRQIVKLTREIYQDLRIDKVISDAENGFRTYDIGHYVGLKVEQEYELLTLLDAKDRQHFLLNHLHNIHPELKEGQKIQDRARLNGHFKHLTPPEW
ncbi:peptidase [Neolewinella aurantiaca]|uniref:Peptidase n=1 Tax=Neolewinella aurantiaca TaxID=2602767 RepID=A0A5C7FJJ4_9BACT|nr:LON peptidase substrate-binding domain-containing protein [Neolewinella aurantiaca]TXF91465.1 peptidase [Neolewinella aurantiaca]